MDTNSNRKQRLRKANREITQLRQENGKLKATANDNLAAISTYQFSIAALRETVSKLSSASEDIEARADDALKESYTRERGYNIAGVHYKYETDYLRDALKGIGLKAREAGYAEEGKTCPECKGSRKITDTAASHIQNPCPKCGVKKPESYLSELDLTRVSKELMEDVGGFKSAMDSYLDNTLRSAAMPKSFFPETDKGFSGKRDISIGYKPQYGEPDQVGDMFAPGAFDVKKTYSRKEDIPVGIPPLAIPVIESKYMPQGFGLFLGGDDIKIIKFDVRDARLKALQAETERQRRIDADVKHLLRPKSKVTINIEVRPSKAFEELAARVRAITDKAELEIEGAVNKLLGKCSE